MRGRRSASIPVRSDARASSSATALLALRRSPRQRPLSIRASRWHRTNFRCLHQGKLVRFSGRPGGRAVRHQAPRRTSSPSELGSSRATMVRSLVSRRRVQVELLLRLQPRPSTATWHGGHLALTEAYPWKGDARRRPKERRTPDERIRGAAPHLATTRRRASDLRSWLSLTRPNVKKPISQAEALHARAPPRGPRRSMFRTGR